MAYLSDIKITINGDPFTYFDFVEVNQGMYGYSGFSISCSFNALEDTDEFLIEKSKEYLGARVLVQLFRKKANDDSQEEGLVYKGVITRISGSRLMDESNTILLEGENYETLLHSKNRSRHFLDKTLEDIVKEVLLPYDRELLRPNISPRNKQVFEYIAQYNESDLDFLRRLSVRFGEWFYHDNEELIFGERPEKLTNLSIGVDIEGMTYAVNSLPLHFTLKGTNKIDPAARKISVDSSSVNLDNSVNMIGRHAIKRSNQIYPETASASYDHYGVTEDSIEDALQKVVELKARTDAINLIQIKGTAIGPVVMAGQTATIKGSKNKSSGKVDYGKFLITQVSYSFDNTLSFNCHFSGISSEANLPENTDPDLIRHCPPQIAVVADNKDPEKLGRVRVRFPWMEEDQSTHWIHINTPYVQSEAGFYFVPAIHSQMMINFEGGDADRPYGEGAFYSRQHPPDEAWTGNTDDDNARIFAIRTAHGQTIELDDSKGDQKIRIYTSGSKHKNEIELNDSNGYITVTTDGDMRIEVKGNLNIKASEITMEADSNIKLKAGGDLKQEGTNIEMSSTSSLKTKATSIELKGDTSLVAEGGGSTEIKSEGVTIIKGSMVKIN